MPVTDPFFHHLMGAALGENGGLYRMDVVDVNQGIFDRYGEVFEPLGSYKRLHFHTGGLSGFLARGPQLTEATGRGAVIREVRSYGA
jgi:hypothetical protein